MRESTTISEVSSKVLKAKRDSGLMCEDLALFYAPSECYDDIVIALRHELEDILEDAEMTADEYNNVIESRVSEKFIFRYDLLV